MIRARKAEQRAKRLQGQTAMRSQWTMEYAVLGWQEGVVLAPTPKRWCSEDTTDIARVPFRVVLHARDISRRAMFTLGCLGGRSGTPSGRC